MLTTFNTIGLYTLFCNKWPEKTKVIGKTGLVIRRETPRDPVRSQNHHLVLWDPAPPNPAPNQRDQLHFAIYSNSSNCCHLKHQIRFHLCDKRKPQTNTKLTNIASKAPGLSNWSYWKTAKGGKWRWEDERAGEEKPKRLKHICCKLTPIKRHKNSNGGHSLCCWTVCQVSP